MSASVAQAVVLHHELNLQVETRTVSEPGADEVRVNIKSGGICGSDLHYYLHAGFGTVRVCEPLVLGHEAAGVIEAIGNAVKSCSVGQRVAINPSRPAGNCQYMQEGQAHHAMDMHFNGSARNHPHDQGLFAQHVIVKASQVVPVKDDTPFNNAACVEPFSVALHAINQAGDLKGKRVLVTGSGAIGCFTILAARYYGAVEIVATDISSRALELATLVGASKVINPATDPNGLAGYEGDKGYFHVVFECSGNDRVLSGILDVVRPRGKVILVGIGKTVSLPSDKLIAKEIELRGSFRCNDEFDQAAKLISENLVDVGPLLTAQFPIGQATEAFQLANDGNHPGKVHILF